MVAQTREVLELFESVAVGKTDPIQGLCDRFDRAEETWHVSISC